MAVDVYASSNKSVAAWIPIRDYEILQQLARRSKVSIAMYVRAIIIDATQEELYLMNSTTITTTIDSTKAQVV